MSPGPYRPRGRSRETPPLQKPCRKSRTGAPYRPRKPGTAGRDRTFTRGGGGRRVRVRAKSLICDSLRHHSHLSIHGAASLPRAPARRTVARCGGLALTESRRLATRRTAAQVRAVLQVGPRWPGPTPVHRCGHQSRPNTLQRRSLGGTQLPRPLALPGRQHFSRQALRRETECSAAAILPYYLATHTNELSNESSDGSPVARL